MRPSPYRSGKKPIDATRGERGSRSSARASGSAFCPTIAQVPARPASWKARAAPRALASFAAPTSTRRAFDARRCRRTLSSAVLNWPSPSSETTGQASMPPAAPP